MDGIFLPTLHTFAMNNIFTGSLGPFRFRIVPKVVMLNQKAMKKVRWRAAIPSPCRRRAARP